MLVYRVAYPREDGRIPVGPYQSGEWAVSDEVYELCDEMSSNHMDMHHPIPWNDGIGEMDCDDYCAFDSMESLKRWFDDWLYGLLDAGFRIFIYDVPRNQITFGMTQIVAKLAHGKLVDVIGGKYGS